MVYELEQAFLISATKKKGLPLSLKIVPEQGGALKIKLPFIAFLTKDQQKMGIKKEDALPAIYFTKEHSVEFINPGVAK